jgi:hypothetical protein
VRFCGFLVSSLPLGGRPRFNFRFGGFWFR